ncbi:MAG: hypothetical protein GY943_38795 [Chloroflexi bacterium]|nr:hypothetical protein [Chloroflexota bacterium]
MFYRNHVDSGRKRPFTLRRILLLSLISVLIIFIGASTAQSSTVIVPTITVSTVSMDQTVSISGVNFPQNQTFTVRMGKMHTAGVGGIVVDTVNTGTSSSFTKSFTIPSDLKGDYQISIRLESAQGYYSYNWFYNNTTSVAPAPAIGYAGIPTISITSVTGDDEVTFKTHNYPPNQTFTVRMGHMFTRGVNGTVVGTFNSNDGTSFTFEIPEALHGSARVAIRTETAHVNPYYSYNWFYNNDANVAAATNNSEGTTTSETESTSPVIVYTGIPTFKMCAVVRDGSATLVTNNFPPNQTFVVTMGSMYTAGIGGTVVGNIESGDGGTIEKTFDIPDHLNGLYRISIRAQTTHAYPYYAYNWFYNNTADVCP